MSKKYDDPAQLGIGSTVWFYSSDMRRYTTGSYTNAVTEIEKFIPYEIVGETSMSWLVAPARSRDKILISKNPAKRRRYGNFNPLWHTHNDGFSGKTYALSLRAKDDHIFDKENRSVVVAALSANSVTTDKLRAIVAILQGV